MSTGAKVAHWDLSGAVMECSRCHQNCSRNSFSQVYCEKCRGEAARESVRDWKRKDRASAAKVRITRTMDCEACGATFMKGLARQFCRPCRRERDARKRREINRRRRQRDDVRKENNRRQRERRAENPKYAIAARMSAGIYQALKSNKDGRSWESLVGYTLDDLICHLSRQFTVGMSWENYGEWHIDHVRPVSSFRFMSPKDIGFKDCWAITNLRPLWSKENMKKGGKLLLLI